MKLLKFSEEHYILADKLDINVGDWVTDTYLMYQCKDNRSLLGMRKVTHSTQPLCIIHGDNNKETISYGSTGYLPISEVKELLGVVDVATKAAELAYSRRIKHQDQFQDGVCSGLEEGYRIGYNQAMKDSKYTKEDMLRAYREGENVRYSRVGEAVLEKQFIQSLQPKTEWDVEIIDGKLKLK